jgi:hypothetical protein
LPHYPEFETPGPAWLWGSFAVWVAGVFLWNIHLGVAAALWWAFATLFFPGMVILVFLWCLAGPIVTGVKNRKSKRS